MKLSWNSIKISIAGAKLIHLVRKDKIWDHGSMVEQVKTAFRQLQKAISRNNPELVKNYMTVMGYHKLRTATQDGQAKNIYDRFKDADLVEVDIIGVHPAKRQNEDRFDALLIERKSGDSKRTEDRNIKNDTQHTITEQWSFVRKGEWWLLDVRR